MNRFKILPKYINISQIGAVSLKKSVIIAHLFYDDHFEKNYKYLKCLDQNIDIYIITSNEKLANLFNSINTNPNIKIVIKPNVGRDYGALFVGAKDIIKNYEYIAFVHDKKRRPDSSDEFANNWEKSFFEYTIGSDIYVKNIIHTFEGNPKIGVLSAPMPPEKFLLGLKGGTWYGNIEQSKEFLKKLGINEEINIYEDALTIGSAFWFRRDALKRIYDVGLTYNDFPGEPFPHDFTIAHVLERVIDITSRYDGYDDYYVISDEDAEEYLNINDNNLSKTLQILRKIRILQFANSELDLDLTYYRACNLDMPKNVLDYCSKYKILYLIADNNDYRLANICLELLNNNGIINRGIFDFKTINKDEILNINHGIIICSNNEYNIKKSIIELGRNDAYSFYDYELMNEK